MKYYKLRQNLFKPLPKGTKKAFTFCEGFVILKKGMSTLTLQT